LSSEFLSRLLRSDYKRFQRFPMGIGQSARQRARQRAEWRRILRRDNLIRIAPAMGTNSLRDKARLRQWRKRQRDREARIDLQATTIAAQMPPKWRDEWLKRVKRNRSRAERANAEIEKALPSIPEPGRDAFLARNRPNTKVSLAELRNRFAREKRMAGQAEQDRLTREYEDYGPDLWTPARGANEYIIPLLGSRIEVKFFAPACQPGSGWWWLIAVGGEGGLSDKCLSDWRGGRVGRRFNPAAMAFLRAARLHATACRWHSAIITSRPEYWLVSTKPMRLPKLFRLERTKS
jgi:hypothetical protein